MNAFLNTLFEKFLPGWKTRITAILVALIGLAPGSAEMPELGGLLGQFGVYLPMWVYTTLYAFGLLGVGEKLEAIKKTIANGTGNGA